MHPAELAIYFSTVCVQWVLALPDDVGIESNSYFHYLHHKYFECNYGGTIAPMDQLFGTFHDGSEEAQERMQQRMRDRLG